MATLVLTTAGQALGAALGKSAGYAALGGVLGKAAGAIAGSVIDQSLFGTSRTIETGRLSDVTVQSSQEGGSLPKVYGRVRLAGQVIWATSFEEEVSEEKQGGKGGGGGSSTTVRSYSYYGNFAVALCEGPITRFGRIWADGKLLDRSSLTIRFYKGDTSQLADPLIAGLQGDAPAYRGTAYVVFEHLPLEPFGNRLPQLTFEVIRSIEPLEDNIRAVTLIPGAGEFVYHPTSVTAQPLPGVTEAVNRHVVSARSDWTAALDELQDLCPNLESVALVVSWFGDDLRAGHCEISPRVEVPQKITSGATWSAAGLSRSAARQVSSVDGRPAFGGTPSDASVVAAIKDLKARGLKVMLYPFILMDVPSGNGLPDPGGADEQPAYPWRGRISAGTASDIASFVGSGAPGPTEWSYRRFILHFASLAQAAGGVARFLIGSEMKALTQAQTAPGTYPFVSALVTLAADVKALLGAGTQVSYAADWSEYGSHVPGDGELRFPLDPLWASPDIDFIGIDNYLPIADQRGAGDPDGNKDPYDLAGLREGITGGEYHDWYYASPEDRNNAVRTPITDGAYGKPWVYRSKDLRSWWSEPHVERAAGLEEISPTGWVPGSKPIVFTELGIPAIDKAANQPNLFVDPKSSESAVPYFSSGARDDLIQRRALEAWLSCFDPYYPDFEEGSNPQAASYTGRMVDPAAIHLWTWDARPYPAFPNYLEVWADGVNWQVGHWLNGRAGTLSLTTLLRQLVADAGIDPADVSVGSLDGVLEGITVPGPVALRDVMEPLLRAFGGMACDLGAQIRIERQSVDAVANLTFDDLVQEDGEAPLLARTRGQESELPSEVRMSAEESARDFQRQSVASRRLGSGSRQIETLDLGAVIGASELQQTADRRLARLWGERERAEFSLSPLRLDLQPGDVFALGAVPGKTFDPPLKLRIERMEDAYASRIEATRVGSTLAPTTAYLSAPATAFRNAEAGKPHGILMDLPPLEDADPDNCLRLAGFARPWPGGLNLFRSVTGTGYDLVQNIERPATLGRLLAPIGPGPVGVWDRATTLEVELYGGVLQSRDAASVLAGKNALAVRTSGGGYEILQFRDAELTGALTYQLSGLLRAQAGTEPEMLQGAETGADVVLLDRTTCPLVPLTSDRIGLELTYRLVPAGTALDAEIVLDLEHTATARGAKPLAPVHLRAKRLPSGLSITFVRQTRRGGDSWDQVEVPLGEALEAYEVDILDAGGSTVLRTLTSSEPSCLYASGDEIADFGGPVSSLTFAVCQMSATAGRGFQRKVTCHV
ncbi:MAG: glycoside hydrolase TIM-barrel-like domain-containing protein [Rhodobacteraceae bacterium]|nr:glycoside hydrolase TIM-barrel-like domain-containing protein [Paracoccaceae bacterium]